jgi:hypothetical protein
MLAARVRLVLEDRVDEVVWQHGGLAEGVNPLADDENRGDGAKSEWIDQEACAPEDVKHGKLE